MLLLDGPYRLLMQTRLALADLAYDVPLETGVYIQPLPLWTNEWAHPEVYSNPRLIENVRREADNWSLGSAGLKRVAIWFRT